MYFNIYRQISWNFYKKKEEIGPACRMYRIERFFLHTDEMQGGDGGDCAGTPGRDRAPGLGTRRLLGCRQAGPAAGRAGIRRADLLHAGQGPHHPFQSLSAAETQDPGLPLT